MVLPKLEQIVARLTGLSEGTVAAVLAEDVPFSQVEMEVIFRAHAVVMSAFERGLSARRVALLQQFEAIEAADK